MGLTEPAFSLSLIWWREWTGGELRVRATE